MYGIWGLAIRAFLGLIVLFTSPIWISYSLLMFIRGYDNPPISVDESILDHELVQATSTALKTEGARKGMGCKSSVIRKSRRRRIGS